MKLKAYMLTCHQRAAVRAQTIASFARSDWEESPELVFDSEFDGLEPQERQIRASKKLLERAVDEGADYFLFLEDDVMFNCHLRHNLTQWFPLRQDLVTLASLYNPVLPELERDDERCFVVADVDTIYGSQAFLLKRRTAQQILPRWDEIPGLQDIKISRLAHLASGGKPIYYHAPSLVQHAGKVSLWNGPYHESSDFSPNFKAA